ncbi:hypothetical protein Brms1b_000226 [Colletotrichum noveboracense]|nr:hypothetical protein Brms1b_000226 [Colletotrichum noveboracense]
MGWTEIPDLTPLERIGPKGYLRYVFPFQLPDDYDLEEAASVLRAGYEAAQRRIAVLDCEAISNSDAKQAGTLKLQRLRSGEVEGIAVKDLRTPGAFPMTYSELKSKPSPCLLSMRTPSCAAPSGPLQGNVFLSPFLKPTSFQGA